MNSTHFPNASLSPMRVLVLKKAIHRNSKEEVPFTLSFLVIYFLK